MMLTCNLDSCDGQQYPGTTIRDWQRHFMAVHTPRVEQLATVDWHTRAMTELKRLAATGQEFAMWQVFQVAGDPPDHKTANGAFASEVDHLGLAHVVRYGKSLRPDTKSSACAYWRGGPKPLRQESAA